jgi:uncharacterized protein YbjT (DUF2867 family)
MGRRLIPALVTRGHRLTALVRAESVRRLPQSVTPVVGNVVTLRQMLATRVWAVDTAGRDSRTFDVPDILRIGKRSRSDLSRPTR